MRQIKYDFKKLGFFDVETSEQVFPRPVGNPHIFDCSDGPNIDTILSNDDFQLRDYNCMVFHHDHPNMFSNTSCTYNGKKTIYAVQFYSDKPIPKPRTKEEIEKSHADLLKNVEDLCKELDKEGLK